LNNNCGADFVITNKKPPTKLERNECYCSFDGDADRVVFYTKASDDSFVLLDGDKITCLFVHTLQTILAKTDSAGKFSIAAVQTAYANGASTDCLENKLKVNVICTSTGVKHLHRAAEQAADIGVYFEANGHGTVIYSERFIEEMIEKRSASHEYELLNLLISMTNLAIGDAMCDMLLVISCLNYLEWDVITWNNLYTEWPSRLAKANVADRFKIKVANADRTIVEPKNMQDELDSLVATVNNRISSSNGDGIAQVKARCFIRPSGTEDVVRIYIEGGCESDINEIYNGAQGLIDKYLR